MFYDNYVRLCMERGETPTAVAKKIGCASSNLAMWKKGSTPRPAVLQRFADYFGVTTQQLLFGDAEQKEQAPAINESLSDPVTAELLKMVREASEEERRDMLDLLRIVQKRREKE